MKNLFFLAAALAAFFIPQASVASNVTAILDGYREVAYQSYTASLNSVKSLRQDVAGFFANPNEETLSTARNGWKQARKHYSQTEGFRFGNWFVDAWEGQVNAWPIDEGFLDYVQDGYVASPTNPLAQQNLVVSTKVPIAGRLYNTQKLNWNKLQYLHDASDHETNVALGYHAIEFMLWGQDLNRHTSGAGQRPASDYAVTEHCSSGIQSAPVEHCKRRRKILDLMLANLEAQLTFMAKRWQKDNGSYGDRLVKGDQQNGLRRMLFGITALSGEELAGERMQVALLANSPEEEQDCFSDDTHNSIYYNGKSVNNIYYGRYQPFQSSDSLARLANQLAPALASKIDAALAHTETALASIQSAGNNGITFDQLIAPSNSRGAALINTAIDALHHQAELFEQLGQALKLGSLNPQAARDVK